MYAATLPAENLLVDSVKLKSDISYVEYPENQSVNLTIAEAPEPQNSISALF